MIIPLRKNVIYIQMKIICFYEGKRCFEYSNDLVGFEKLGDVFKQHHISALKNKSAVCANVKHSSRYFHQTSNFWPIHFHA